MFLTAPLATVVLVAVRASVGVFERVRCTLGTFVREEGTRPPAAELLDNTCVEASCSGLTTRRLLCLLFLLRRGAGESACPVAVVRVCGVGTGTEGELLAATMSFIREGDTDERGCGAPPPAAADGGGACLLGVLDTLLPCVEARAFDLRATGAVGTTRDGGRVALAVILRWRALRFKRRSYSQTQTETPSVNTALPYKFFAGVYWMSLLHQRA